MKQLVLLISMLWSLTLTAAVVQPGSPISRYPNTPTFHPSDLMILAITNTTPPTNKNMKMGDLALQIINSNKVVVLSGTNTLVSNTSTNGTNFYSVNSTAGDGDAGGTNSRQGGTLVGTNLVNNPNVATNILGAGTVTVTSNNLGTWTITGAASAVGVGLAPGTTTIVVDGSLNTRTSVLTSAASIIFSNLTIGQPVRWYGFASNGAWQVTVPQAHDSNLLSRGIEQPFSNNWVMVEAIQIATAWTNFDSEVPGFIMNPGTNVVFDTNLVTRHITVSAAGMVGGGDQVWTNDNGVIKTLAYGTNVQFSPGVANGATAIAHSFDTTNLLTDDLARLLSVRNKGTNRFQIFADGETRIGKDLEAHFNPAGAYRLLVAKNLVTDPGANAVYFGSFDPGSLDWGFEVATDTNSVQLTLTAGAVIPTWLIPTIADGVMAYQFDTTLGHTTGNLAEFQNFNLPHFSVAATNGIVTPRISAYGATSQPWQFGSVVGDLAQVTINGVLVNLATNSGSGGSGTNFDSIIITNQVRYIAREFNGSNGTSGVNLTNNFDVSRATFNRTTNVIGTNLVYHLSNLVAGSSFIHNMYGGPSAKTVSYRIAGGGTGTNIFWYSATNGSHDFQANPSIAYTVAGFIDAQTNVLMNLNATEVLPFGFITGTSIVVSNATATNLTSVTAAFVNAGISNLLATNINGQLLSFSNGFFFNLTNNTLATKAGGSTAYAKVGGTISVNTTPVASAGSLETNLITYSVPANILTNNSDRLRFRASGRFAATANAKQIKAVWGSQTILDTGSQVNNGGAWTVEGEIIRTGNTAQFASAEIHGLTNELYTTAGAVTLAQTNGIGTVLKLTSTAAGDGDVTNRTLVVEWSPAP